MSVNELFETIQEKFSPEELEGEFVLQGNCIIWSYNLDKDSEEIELPSTDEDEEFLFDSTSPEELLQDAFIADSEKLEGLLDELEETEYWTLSEPETNGNVISFKIF